MIIFEQPYHDSSGVRWYYTAKNIVISRNFLVWKLCWKAQFPHSFGWFARNYGETVASHKNSTPGWSGKNQKRHHWKKWDFSSIREEMWQRKKLLIFLKNLSDRRKINLKHIGFGTKKLFWSSEVVCMRQFQFPWKSMCKSKYLVLSAVLK